MFTLQRGFSLQVESAAALYGVCVVISLASTFPSTCFAGVKHSSSTGPRNCTRIYYAFVCPNSVASTYQKGAGVAQLVLWFNTRLTVRGSSQGGGDIFRTSPDLTWGPPASYTSKMGTESFPRGKAAGVWRWPPTPSSTEVEGRVEVYICSPSGPSWPVLWWTLPLTSTGGNQGDPLLLPFYFHSELPPNLARSKFHNEHKI